MALSKLILISITRVADSTFHIVFYYFFRVWFRKGCKSKIMRYAEKT